MDPAKIMQSVVNSTTTELSDEEILALALSAQLGTDPTHVMGYEKAKHLFDTTKDGHPAAHELTAQALARAAQERHQK